ncbi:desmoglein-2-like [Girardinichthys multiradiatus]|uniref:desmoglein-2-like n=1 Tax=Girardinichthys multiradiatus TaxID=208333 RepID=UPI001FAD76EE|nr:desmoglein-2-like [Girardinichthys multiradiatus]
MIFVQNAMLDREEEDTYILTVTGKDLYGAEGGNIATGTVTITILDVNDNLPTLEKPHYDGTIEENTFGVEVMRIKAQDLDLKNTDNWEAVFDIVKGNEAGYFSIKTDPRTNEGILMLEKPVDYEDIKSLELGLAVRNKAPQFDGSGSNGASIGFGGGAGGATGASGASGGSGTGGATGATGTSGGAGGGVAGGASGGAAGGASGTSGSGSGSASGTSGASGTTFKTYPIKIAVKNQPEGPQFDQAVKAIPVVEGGDIVNKVIGRYPATDKDTGKPAENVRYVKGSDPFNWFTVDPETAEIKLNKIPDRESPFLVNGTYTAKILCITKDMPAKTATGTIAIQVEDFNDNCPMLTSDFQSMCTSKDSVIVDAKDEDQHPNGAPFEFTIVSEDRRGNWQVEHYNETAAIVRAQEEMWPGVYNLLFVVKDQQGLACPKPQKMTVHVCVCEDGVVCAKRDSSSQFERNTELGAAAIGLFFLGLMLLIVIPLLVFVCKCGGAAKFTDLFTEMPFPTKTHLINYHTEGLGDNVEVPLLNVPPPGITGIAQSPIGMIYGGGLEVQQSVDSMNAGMLQGFSSSGHKEGMWGMNQWVSSAFNSESGGRESRGGGGFLSGMALPENFLNKYYNMVTSGDDGKLGLKDGLLVYDDEGQGSSAGSVGCCSTLESDTDLHFLDDLGIRFKTLAEICEGKTIQTEITQVDTPRPNAPVNKIQMSEPNLVTSQEMYYSSKIQPANSRTEQTLVNETTEHSKIRDNKAAVRKGMTTVQTEMAHQNQMLVLNQEQPVYFTTTPVLQPMHYVVQQPLQNAMMVAEAPIPNLQPMVVFNGTDIGSSQVIVQGQTMMPNAQLQSLGTVLVDSREIQGTSGYLVSGSQNMMFLKGKVPAGSLKVLSGNQATLIQGGTILNEQSGSQTIMNIGESNTRGHQLLEGRGVFQNTESESGIQIVHDISGGAYSGSQGSTSFNILSKAPTIQNTLQK